MPGRFACGGVSNPVWQDVPTQYLVRHGGLMVPSAGGDDCVSRPTPR